MDTTLTVVGLGGSLARTREAEPHCRWPSREPRTPARGRGCSTCESSICRCSTRRTSRPGCQRADRDLPRGGWDALEQPALSGVDLGRLEERARLAAPAPGSGAAVPPRQGRRSHQPPAGRGTPAINTMEFVTRALRAWAVPYVVPVGSAARVFNEAGQIQDRSVGSQLTMLGREVVRAAERFSADDSLHRATVCQQAAERVAAVA